MSITRRRLVASGTGLAVGGPTAVLVACGGDARDERTAERDVALLERTLDAEATLAEAYETALGQALGAQATAAVEAFASQVQEHLTLLGSRISDAGGSPDPSPGDPPAAESAVEAIRIALEASVATAHDIVGALSTAAGREALYRVMIADSAQLAVIRGVLGEPQVPAAFVTGGADPPLAIDPDTGAPEGGS